MSEPLIPKGTRVRHIDAGTYGTTLSDSFPTHSPYNPGEWVLVEADDGFAYWSPIESLTLLKGDKR